MTERDRSRDTGLAVRRARTLRSVSLRELARRISVSPATMSAIETGTTPLTVARLFQIGEALAVSVIELIGDEAAPEESRVEDAGSACAAPGICTSALPGMVYDGMPVFDHFKKVDDDTIMGIMNGKAMMLDQGQNYYFGLERDLTD